MFAVCFLLFHVCLRFDAAVDIFAVSFFRRAGHDYAAMCHAATLIRCRHDMPRY